MRGVEVLLFVFIVWFVLGGVVGHIIGKSKGREVEGFWLGALLGWIGWIIVAVMQPSVEAQARRDMQVAQVAQRISSPPSTGAPKKSLSRTDLNQALDNTSSLREEASRDPSASGVIAAVNLFAEEVAPKRRVSEWMFADGQFPLVVRHEGKVYLVSATRVRVARPGEQPSFDETPDGVLLGAMIDNTWLPGVRPDARARQFLGSMRASRTERPARDDEVAVSTSSVGSPTAVGGSSIRERLASLDDLRDDGVITDAEHAARRAAILDEV